MFVKNNYLKIIALILLQMRTYKSCHTKVRHENDDDESNGENGYDYD